MSILWPFINFVMAINLILFQSQKKNKIHSTNLQEDHDHGSSLLCETDQQTKKGQALRRKN